ncbi:MAG: hypothetical protein JO362_17015 [Streptomycetaceae bacterium]|nr:hypothetical protein [Streptomycetaceae bacterium]
MIQPSVTSESSKVQQKAAASRELRDIVARTLPESGIDRMTDQRIEEVIAIPALTAHI